MTGRSIVNRNAEPIVRAEPIVKEPLSRSGQCLRWGFAVLLAASALGKLADMRGFIDVAATFRSLPGAWLTGAAWALALSEAVLAVSLASGRHLTRAALGVTLLHCLYFAWIALALARGLQLTNCGCFGVYWPRPLTLLTLIEDGILLGAAYALLRILLRARESA